MCCSFADDMGFFGGAGFVFGVIQAHLIACPLKRDLLLLSAQ